MSVLEVGSSRARDLAAGSWPAMYAVARWIGTWCFTVPYRLRAHGRERVPATGPIVLVANHSAFVDGPLLFAMLGAAGRRPVFLVKSEMYTGPVGWALRRLGQIPVKRGVPDRAALLAALYLLRSGGLVGVFPEGTRSTTDLQTAHNGAAWLARSTGAAVLPAVVRGTRRPAGRSGRRWRPRVDVLIGEPFQLDPAKGRPGLTAATEQVRTALVDLIAELDRMRGDG